MNKIHQQSESNSLGSTWNNNMEKSGEEPETTTYMRVCYTSNNDSIQFEIDSHCLNHNEEDDSGYSLLDLLSRNYSLPVNNANTRN